jgi:predicted  nucleic acid-binding Zn-ribbon protein
VADNLNKTQKQLQELQEQLLLVEDSLNGIASKVTATISNQLGALNVVTKKTAQRYSKDFSQATEKVKKNFQEQAEIRKKILNGETLSVTLVKKLEKLEKDSNKQKEIALRSAENLKCSYYVFIINIKLLNLISTHSKCCACSS